MAWRVCIELTVCWLTNEKSQCRGNDRLYSSKKFALHPLLRFLTNMSLNQVLICGLIFAAIASFVLCPASAPEDHTSSTTQQGELPSTQQPEVRGRRIALNADQMEQFDETCVRESGSHSQAVTQHACITVQYSDEWRAASERHEVKHQHVRPRIMIEKEIEAIISLAGRWRMMATSTLME